jgi:hypothetical protein
MSDPKYKNGTVVIDKKGRSLTLNNGRVVFYGKENKFYILYDVESVHRENGKLTVISRVVLEDDVEDVRSNSIKHFTSAYD